jgi:hypothetical protein
MSGPASEGLSARPLRDGKRVLVYVRFERGARARVGGLHEAGAKIVDVSPRYQTVTVAVRPEQLAGLAEVTGVTGVTQALAPITAAGPCPSGGVVSEGDEQLKAADARSLFALDGSGVTVGVLSDSFDQATEAADGSGPVATTAAQDAESGDLPGIGNPCEDTTPVNVLEPDNSAGADDEGRGMAQIVHDLAPKANLDFASAFNGEPAFAQSIRDLAAAGAQVIVDDVFYLEEPFFQDGPVAVAANEVVEAGTAYFSAAGNDNLIDSEGHDIASWETPEYRDAGSCPVAVQALPGANGAHCLDFNPGSQTDKTFGVKVEPGAELVVDLQWDEPWNGVTTDLDAFLLDASGSLIEKSAQDNIGNSQKPLEVIEWTNNSSSTRTVQLVVNRFVEGSDPPRLKLALIENGAGVAATEYPRSTGEDVVGPTVFGHSGAAGAISVAAVPFSNGAAPEEYSSRGPVRHDFGPADGVNAAPPLASTELLSKPDLAATDCGQTTFFAFFSGGGWHFCGTSAAAPHAAAVAALMLGAEPAATPADLRTAMLASAEPVGAFGPCAVGAGLVEAVGAIEELPAPLPFTPSPCLPPAAEGSAEEARAAGNWGSEVPPVTPKTSTQTPFVSAPEPVSPPAESQRVALPRTFFLRRPSRLIRTRLATARAVFRFGSNDPEATFACKVDTGLMRFCGSRLAERFGLGSHVVWVKARDAAGNVDPTPAVYRFRVKGIH